MNYSEPALVQQVQQPFEPFDFDSQVFRGFLRDFGDKPQNTDQVEQHKAMEDNLQYNSPFLNAIIEKECTLDDLRVHPIAEKTINGTLTTVRSFNHFGATHIFNPSTEQELFNV